MDSVVKAALKPAIKKIVGKVSDELHRQTVIDPIESSNQLFDVVNFIIHEEDSTGAKLDDSPDTSPTSGSSDSSSSGGDEGREEKVRTIIKDMVTFRYGCNDRSKTRMHYPTDESWVNLAKVFNQNFRKTTEEKLAESVARGVIAKAGEAVVRKGVETFRSYTDQFKDTRKSDTLQYSLYIHNRMIDYCSLTFLINNKKTCEFAMGVVLNRLYELGDKLLDHEKVKQVWNRWNAKKGKISLYNELFHGWVTFEDDDTGGHLDIPINIKYQIAQACIEMLSEEHNPILNNSKDIRGSITEDEWNKVLTHSGTRTEVSPLVARQGGGSDRTRQIGGSPDLDQWILYIDSLYNKLREKEIDIILKIAYDKECWDTLRQDLLYLLNMYFMYPKRMGEALTKDKTSSHAWHDTCRIWKLCDETFKEQVADYLISCYLQEYYFIKNSNWLSMVMFDKDSWNAVKYLTPTKKGFELSTGKMFNLLTKSGERVDIDKLQGLEKIRELRKKIEDFISFTPAGDTKMLYMINEAELGLKEYALDLFSKVKYQSLEFVENEIKSQFERLVDDINSLKKLSDPSPDEAAVEATSVTHEEAAAEVAIKEQQRQQEEAGAAAEEATEEHQSMLTLSPVSLNRNLMETSSAGTIDTLVESGSSGLSGSSGSSEHHLLVDQDMVLPADMEKVIAEWTEKYGNYESKTIEHEKHFMDTESIRTRLDIVHLTDNAQLTSDKSVTFSDTEYPIWGQFWDTLVEGTPIDGPLYDLRIKLVQSLKKYKEPYSIGGDPFTGGVKPHQRIRNKRLHSKRKNRYRKKSKGSKRNYTKNRKRTNKKKLTRKKTYKDQNIKKIKKIKRIKRIKKLTS